MSEVELLPLGCILPCATRVAEYTHVCPHSEYMKGVKENRVTWWKYDHLKVSISRTSELVAGYKAANMGVAAKKLLFLKYDHVMVNPICTVDL